MEPMQVLVLLFIPGYLQAAAAYLMREPTKILNPNFPLSYDLPYSRPSSVPFDRKKSWNLKYPPPKYSKWPYGKSKATPGKKCCGGLKDGARIWFHKDSQFGYVLKSDYSSNQVPEWYRNIKPVTEHIEDDLKYDFRTKTHSYR